MDKRGEYLLLLIDFLEPGDLLFTIFLFNFLLVDHVLNQICRVVLSCMRQ